jgi:signal-transduction protein with cAMP-binding, CBS, and nucleotidyltransferase domain
MLSIDFLEKSELFKGLNDDQLTAVQTCCQEKDFPRGEMVFVKDQSVEDLYIVLEGQVELRFDMPGRPTSDKNTISSVSEADVFGWSSFVPPYKTTLSAYCAKNCKIVLMKREGLLSLFEKEPRIGYVVTSNLAKVVGKRFHRIQDEIVSRRGHDIMFDW